MKAFFVLLVGLNLFFGTAVAQNPAVAQPLSGVITTPSVVQAPDTEVVTSADLPPRDQLDAKTLFDVLFEPIFGAIFILLSYLGYYIPGINRIQDTLARVVTIGCILGIGFVLFGVSFWKVATTFLISSGAYAWFFKAIFKTPRAAIE